VAIDLPGHGRDQAPLGDVRSDAARLRTQLDVLDGGVVLVGHSYGGAVVTEAGDHPAVDHLLYIAAFPLELDESCATAAGAESKAEQISYEGRPNLAAGFVAGPNGSVSLDPDAAAACLYNGCDPVTTAWAVAQLGPQSLASLQQTPTSVGWRAKPSTYAVCADDLTVHPSLQRILARRCTSVLEWPTDHSPFLSRPDLVAELIARLALAPASGTG
jgi:pimeloyl-ACP methyl ester carboxylesterase